MLSRPSTSTTFLRLLYRMQHGLRGQAVRPFSHLTIKPPEPSLRNAVSIARCQQFPAVHYTQRRLKATVADSPSTAAGIVELPEGQYRDYGTLPAKYTAKSELSIPLGMLNRAREIAMEHAELKTKLEKDYDSATAIKAGKLAGVAKALREFDEGFYNLHQLRDMLLDSTLSSDPDLLTELDTCKATLTSLSTALSHALIPPHPFSHLPCIIEIRPGAGGGEAAIFAANLYKMYTTFFSNKYWPISVISLDTTIEMLGGEGVDEAIFSVDKPGAYDLCKTESGVHRVQRIPVTETKGRVHTSTATVMVLPMFPEGAEEIDPNSLVDPKDVRVDIMRARGAGGQHVNTTDSAVRLTHIPTGIVAAIQDTRSQHKNREKAWQILRARVAEKLRAEKEAEEMALRKKSLAGASGGEVTGSGGARSDKVRTYNFKEGRVTDHRCGLTVYDLENVIAGEVEALEKVMKEVGKWMVGVEVEKVAAEATAAGKA